MGGHVRQGVVTLYRGLEREPIDKTYEKERLRVIEILRSRNQRTAATACGDVNRESHPTHPLRRKSAPSLVSHPATANLGLYARHRGKRGARRGPKMGLTAANNVRGGNVNHHGHCKADNFGMGANIARDGGSTKFSLRPSPLSLRKSSKKKSESLLRSSPFAGKGTGRLRGDPCPESGKRGHASPPAQANRIPLGEGPHSPSQYQGGDNNKGKEGRTQGGKWSPEERHKLNELYWELGRPPRPGRSALNDHLEHYARRHKIRYGDRPGREVHDRVRHMLKYNQFKERGEEEYWDSLATTTPPS